MDVQMVKKEKFLPDGLFRYKVLKTVALTGILTVMGICNSLMPATLPDLCAQVGITVEEAGRVFAFNGIGAIIGSMLSSVSDRYFKLADFIIGFWTSVSGAANMMKPLSPNLQILCTVSFIEGIGWSIVNAASNSMILSMWEEKSGPPILAMYFGFPLGFMIGPLIAYPFVSKETDNSTSAIASTADYSIIEFESTAPDSQISIAYGIAALCAFFMAAIFICGFHCLCKNNKNEIWKNKGTSKWKDIFSPTVWADGNGKQGAKILILSVIYYFVFVASISGFYKYYTSYAIESDLGYTNQEGTIFSADTNLAGALGRIAGIPASRYISIKVIITLLAAAQAVLSILTMTWGLQSKSSFFISNFMYSFVVSPLWPCGYLWTDQYIHVLAFVVGITDIAAKFSDVIFGYLFGYMYEYVSQESIFYCTTAFGLLLCIYCVVMNPIANFGVRYHKKSEDTKSVSAKNECTHF